MSVNPISLAQASQGRANPGESLASLTSDAFMQLLLTQLRNQNPMEPMKENEMISQMAQLNSVQELQKMSGIMKSLEQTNQMFSAAAMIGKKVTYKNSDGELMEDVVKSVAVENQKIYLWVGDDTIGLSDVLGVR